MNEEDIFEEGKNTNILSEALVEEYVEKQFKLLKQRIPYDEYKYESETTYELYLRQLLVDSENIALAELYPFSDEYTGLELPPKYYNWQLRACVELNKWQNNQGIKSYSENGLSWSRDNDGAIPTRMLDELIPKVGIPKRKNHIPIKVNPIRFEVREDGKLYAIIS